MGKLKWDKIKIMEESSTSESESNEDIILSEKDIINKKSEELEL